MKRIITMLLATVTLAGVLVAVTPGPASAVPAPGCRAVASTQNVTTWAFNSMFDWHYSRRLTTSPGCAGQIYFRSEGWRFDFYQCGEMWVRRFRSDGTSYVVDGSRRTVCGGNTYLMISRIAAGRDFRIEGWSNDLRDRESATWPVGVILY